MREFLISLQSLFLHDFTRMQFQGIARSRLAALQDRLRETQKMIDRAKADLDARKIDSFFDTSEHFVFALAPPQKPHIRASSCRWPPLNSPADDFLTRREFCKP